MINHLLMLIDAHGVVRPRIDHGTYTASPDDRARAQRDARRLAMDHPPLEAVVLPEGALYGRVPEAPLSLPVQDPSLLAPSEGQPVRWLLLTLDPDGELGACGAYDPGQMALARSTRDDLAQALPTHRVFLAPALAFEAFTDAEVVAQHEASMPSTSSA